MKGEDMKSKRSERLVDMTYQLTTHPCKLFPYRYFTERYETAKSSISEDITLLKRIFKDRSIGKIKTHTGAAGGVQYFPYIEEQLAQQSMIELSEILSNEERLLPGGYIYLSDILGYPQHIKMIGKIIAAYYACAEINIIMTVAAKGIPLAQAVSYELGIPFIMVRRDSKITEGPTVSVNYASGSSSRVQKMELSKRSLKKGSRVLFVDDFVRGGGTLEGVQSLVKEFDSTLIDSIIFVEGAFSSDKREAMNYHSLLSIDQIDVPNKKIAVSLGSLFQSKDLKA